MVIVSLVHQGNTFFLRSTVWTSERARATEFADKAAAQAGLDKAKPFMKAAQYKAAQIRDAETGALHLRGLA